MKATIVFVIFLACLVLNSVHSRSTYQLNEKERMIRDIFSFQPRDEVESRERRLNGEQLGEWYEDNDNDRQSCAGLHGSWFC